MQRHLGRRSGAEEGVEGEEEGEDNVPTGGSHQPKKLLLPKEQKMSKTGRGRAAPEPWIAGPLDGMLHCWWKVLGPEMNPSASTGRVFPPLSEPRVPKPGQQDRLRHKGAAGELQGCRRRRK